MRRFWRYLAGALALVTIAVLMLAAAGIYALMSFAVARRTREIAIRAALGAAPRRLLWTVLGRAARQLTLGLGIGSVLAFGIFMAAQVGFGSGLALVFVVSALMTVVALLAASGPPATGLADPAQRGTEG